MLPIFAKTSNSLGSEGGAVVVAGRCMACPVICCVVGACATGCATGAATGTGGAGGGGGGVGATTGGVGVGAGAGAGVDDFGAVDAGRGVHASSSNPLTAAGFSIAVLVRPPVVAGVLDERETAGEPVRDSCSDAEAIEDVSTPRVDCFVGAGLPRLVLFFKEPFGPLNRPGAGLVVELRFGGARPSYSA